MKTSDPERSMATTFDPKLGTDLVGARLAAQDFARRVVAPRGWLAREEAFPPDLWEALRDEGWLDLGSASADRGAEPGAIAAAAEAMAREGGCLGLVMALTVHWIGTRIIRTGAGGQPVPESLRARLAGGRLAPSVAVSEAGVGAHPKLLTTSARRDGASWVLEGEKSFVTNGPMADVFIVMAVTGERAGRKEYTAILLPADAPGLELVPREPLPAFRPCQHCGLRLRGARAPLDHVLGEPGRGYESVSMAFARLEQAYYAAAAVGGRRRALEALLRDWLASGRDPAALGDEPAAMRARLDQMERAAFLAAAAAEDPERVAEAERVLCEFQVASRDLQARWVEWLKGPAAPGARLGEALEVDLAALDRLGAGALKAGLRKSSEALWLAAGLEP